MTDDPLAPLLALPDVAEAADRARVAVDRLLTHPSMRRGAAAVAVAAGARSARASAALAGVAESGALRVAAELLPLAETWRHAPRQALARLHLLAAPSAGPDTAGRPAVPGAGPRLDALMAVLAVTRVPAVVVSGVVHGELMALRPFASANDLVARGAARVVLVALGLDPRGVVAPDVRCLAERPAYEASLAGFAGGDPGPWLAFWAGAVEADATESVRQTAP